MQTEIEYRYCNDFVKVITRKDSEDCIKNENQPQATSLEKHSCYVFNDNTRFGFPFTTCASASFETAKKQSGPKSRADHIAISALWQRQYCSNSSPENAWAYVKHIRNAEILWKDYLVVPLGVAHHMYTTYMHTLPLYIHALYRDTHTLHAHCACMYMLVMNRKISRVCIITRKANRWNESYFLDLENFPSIIQLQSSSYQVGELASLFYTDGNWSRPGHSFVASLSLTASNLGLSVKGLLYHSSLLWETQAPVQTKMEHTMLKSKCQPFLKTFGWYREEPD